MALKQSFRNNFGDIVNLCDSCQGEGCDACNGTGWKVTWHKQGYPQVEHAFADLPIVPMPYGKMLPDLTDCSYPNEGLSEPGDEEYDEILDEKFLCPNCGSDNVVGLSSEYNPECSVMGENRTPSGRWFCISCHDSWCYEREF